MFIWHHHGYSGLMESKDKILSEKKRLKSLGHTLKIITTVREILPFCTSRINYLKNECGFRDLTKETYLTNNMHFNIQTKYFMYNIFGEHLHEHKEKHIVEKVNKVDKNDILNLSSVIDLFIETKNINIFKEKFLIFLKLNIDYYKKNLNKGRTKNSRKITFDNCIETILNNNLLDNFLINHYKNTKYMDINHFFTFF